MVDVHDLAEHIGREWNPSAHQSPLKVAHPLLALIEALAQDGPCCSRLKPIDASADKMPHIVGHLSFVVVETLDRRAHVTSDPCFTLLGAGHPQRALVIDKGCDSKQATPALFEGLDVGRKLTFTEDSVNRRHTNLACRNDVCKTSKAVHGTRCSIDNQMQLQSWMLLGVSQQMLAHLRHLAVTDDRDTLSPAPSHDVHQPLHHSLTTDRKQWFWQKDSFVTKARSLSSCYDSVMHDFLSYYRIPRQR